MNTTQTPGEQQRDENFRFQSESDPKLQRLEARGRLESRGSSKLRGRGDQKSDLTDFAKG